MRRNFLSAVMLNATAAVLAALLLAGCGDSGPGSSGVDPGLSNTPPTPAFAAACQSLGCTFVDNSADADGRVAAWVWNFGDSTSSTDQSPTHVYATPGQFTVTLHVTDDAGAQATTTREVKVSLPTPQAPEVVTIAAHDWSSVAATLRANVNPHGTIAETWFEWGSSVDRLEHQTPIRTVSGTAGQTVSEVITFLEPATTYYFRVVARNDSGTRTGATLSFVTDSALAPLLPSGTAMAFVRAGNVYVYRVTENGTELTQLTTAGTFEHPTWSPDARHIAFASFDSPRRIYVMNADGSGLGLFAEGRSPAWSPDGRRIAYAALDSGRSAIFVRSLDDPTNTARIGFDCGWCDFPAWSPDGSRIAFVSDWAASDFAEEVYIANVDGSGIIQVTNGFLGNVQSWPTYTIYSQPAWSPDGHKLAVVACKEWQFHSCANSTVGIMEADGSGFTTLAYTTGFARPTWTADGAALAFSRTCWDHQCGSDVFQVSLDGSGEQLLIADAYSGIWAP